MNAFNEPFTPTPDEDMQRILNLAIDSGAYGPVNNYDTRGDYDKDQSSSMCDAIYTAHMKRLISYDEYARATRTIAKWLSNSKSGRAYLEATLMDFGMPYEFEDRLKIYKDWANRPFKNKLEF